MLRLLILLSIVGFLCINAQEPGWPWPTEFDKPFSFHCPSGEALNQLKSKHSNRREDREWYFSCAKPPNNARLGRCRWTGYVNNFDGLLNFQCSNNAVIAGINSYHQNKQEDRRFKFYCCDTVGSVVHSCANTRQVNNYDGDLSYTVPNDRVLKGVVSIHKNKNEDRIFWFNVCKVQ